MNRDRFDALFELAADGAAEDSVTIRIRGGCMSPAIGEGERLEVRRSRLVLPGDVIVFRDNTCLVAHRLLGWVIREGAIGLVTRGDRCTHHDGVIPISHVVGRIDTPVSVLERMRAACAFVALILGRLTKR